MEPYASRVLVFTRRTMPSTQMIPASPSKQIEINNDWRVSFGPNGPTLVMNHTSLVDGRRRVQCRFSGVATYEKDVMLTDAMFEKGRKIVLDFGEGQANQSQPSQAGMQAMFDAPFARQQLSMSTVSVPVRSGVRLIRSTLRVCLNLVQTSFALKVSNTAINYMAGHSLPDYRLLNLRFGERFRMQEMEKVQPVSSGNARTSPF